MINPDYGNLRPYPPLLADHQPDILFHGDSLKRARYREKGHAASLRRHVHFYRTTGKPLTAEDWDWIREARKAHSKAVLNAREYDRLIAERDRHQAMQKMLREVHEDG